MKEKRNEKRKRREEKLEKKMTIKVNKEAKKEIKEKLCEMLVNGFGFERLNDIEFNKLKKELEDEVGIEIFRF